MDSVRLITTDPDCQYLILVALQVVGFLNPHFDYLTIAEGLQTLKSFFDQAHSDPDACGISVRTLGAGLKAGGAVDALIALCNHRKPEIACQAEKLLSSFFGVYVESTYGGNVFIRKEDEHIPTLTFENTSDLCVEMDSLVV